MDYIKIRRFIENEYNSDIVNELIRCSKLGINYLQRIRHQYPNIPWQELLTVYKLQKRGLNKFSDAMEMMFTAKGVEQCSSQEMAEYHRRKIGNITAIADLCCGIGGDLRALAREASRVYAVDLSENALECARHNCRNFNNKIEFLQIPAEDFHESVDVIFADPDRRAEGRRIVEVESMQPSLKDLLALQYSRKLCESMMIKLSPAIDYKKVSAEYFGESGLFPDKNHSWTFVEEDNILKEVLLTTGLLADELKYNAVLLSCKKELSGTGEEKINIAGWQKYLYEPAKAVIRAGLVQKLGLEFDLELVDENLALLSSNNLVFSPSFKVYQVKDVYKYHKRLLQDLCREHAVGELVIKTRGFPQTTEQIRSKLKLKGSEKLTVIIVRRNKGHQLAIIDKV